MIWPIYGADACEKRRYKISLITVINCRVFSIFFESTPGHNLKLPLVV